MLWGNKVVLREKQISDATKDYAWRTDRELAQLDAMQPLLTPFPEFLIDYSEELRHQNRRRCRFAIETLDGEYIGNCTYYDIDNKQKEAELGIMIGDREYWGKGYGSDVVATLVHHLFRKVGLKRLYLHTLEWNVRAQRCFERCGFVSCGHVKKMGDDFIRMELYRDWLEGADSQEAILPVQDHAIVERWHSKSAKDL